MLYQDPMLHHLHRFAAFARSRDPEEMYDFCSYENCAVCQYLGAKCDKWGDVVPSDISVALNSLAHPPATCSYGGHGTWGDLAERIETAIAARVRA